MPPLGIQIGISGGSSTSGGFNPSDPGGGFTGLLDEYSGAAAAYSVRRLSSSYTDGLIRVRRSSDDAEQDIGFDANGDLDTTALLAFVGNKNLFEHSDPATGDTRVMSGTITSSANDWGLGFNNKLIFAETIPSTEVVYDAELEASTEYTLAVRVKFPNGETIDSTKFGSGSGKYFYFIVGAGAISSGYSVTELATNTYLVQVTTTTGSASNSVGVVRTTANDGASMEMTGFQINEGDTLLSYTATDGGVSGDGAVTTWYDQTGNGNNATNSTASEQPLIVNGGTLTQLNSKAAINGDGADDVLSLSTGIDLSSGYSIFQVVQVPSANTYGITLSNSAGNDRNLIFGSTYRFQLDGTNNNNGGASGNKGAQYLWSLVNDASGNLDMNRNGSAYGSQLTGLTGTFTFENIGTNISVNSFEYFQELIVFNSDQSANLGTITTGGGTLIQGNINTYFDIV